MLKESRKWNYILLAKTMPNNRLLPSVAVVKNLEAEFHASGTMRNYLDHYMMLTITQARNVTVEFCNREERMCSLFRTKIWFS